jgi:hypothetical protein
MSTRRPYALLIAPLLMPILWPFYVLLTDRQRLLSASVIQEYGDDLAELDRRASDLFRGYAEGIYYPLILALVVALLWTLVITRRNRAGSDEGARALAPVWWGGLGLVAVTAEWGFGWWFWARANAPGDPDLQMMVVVRVLTVLAAAALYYLVTAMFTRPSLRVAIPFATRWLD